MLGIEADGGGSDDSSSGGIDYNDWSISANQTVDIGYFNSTSIFNRNASSTLDFSSHQQQTYSKILSTAEVIGDYLSFYYTPILVLSGSIGNILSVVVFFKTKLKKLSSSHYLAALAISDTCFLFGLFVQWLNFVDVDLYNREFFCQFFTFASNLCSFCSVWFVVAFTVERFIAVMYPLKRQSMCTVKRAKIVLIGLTAVGSVHCMPFLFVSSPIYVAKINSTICDIRLEYKEYVAILNYVDTAVVFAVPLTTIVILNTFTGCTVWKFATVRRSLTMQKRKPQITKSQFSSFSRTSTPLKRQNSSLISRCSHPNGQTCISQHLCDAKRKAGRRKNTNSSQIKVTKMLLIVSTVFVCLNLPSYVMRVRAYLETDASKKTVVTQYITWFLFITNFGINFVLYCVSGQNFRKAVVSLFRNVSTSHKEGTTQITGSENFRNSVGTSTRRRIATRNCWNESYEMEQLN